MNIIQLIPDPGPPTRANDIVLPNQSGRVQIGRAMRLLSLALLIGAILLGRLEIWPFLGPVGIGVVGVSVAVAMGVLIAPPCNPATRLVLRDRRIVAPRLNTGHRSFRASTIRSIGLNESPANDFSDKRRTQTIEAVIVLKSGHREAVLLLEADAAHLHRWATDRMIPVTPAEGDLN